MVALAFRRRHRRSPASARIRVGQTNERCSAGKDKSVGLGPLAARNRDAYEAMKRVSSFAVSERGWCSRLHFRPSESHTLSPPASPAPVASMRLVPLLAYALFGPSRILVLGPETA